MPFLTVETATDVVVDDDVLGDDEDSNDWVRFVINEGFAAIIACCNTKKRFKGVVCKSKGVYNPDGLY